MSGIIGSFLLVLLSLDTPIVTDQEIIDVDGFIELNHVINDDAQPGLTQIIVWEWNNNLKTHVVKGFIVSYEKYDKTKEELKKELEEVKKKFKIKEWPGGAAMPFPTTKWTGSITTRIQRRSDSRYDLIVAKSREIRTIYRCRHFIETSYHNFDIEIENGNILPRDDRTKLIQRSFENLNYNRMILLKNYEERFNIFP